MRSKIPRSSKESEDLLRSLVPEGKDITVRPMFGNLSAFSKGNMFMGVFGEDLFFRLSEPDRAELLESEGASVFAPMAGRPMKEYVVVPRPWRADRSKLKPWVAKSLEWTGKMPAKTKR